jgi:hypothetical protein
VDPENDSITRFVVHHYRYDPDRHERRHVVVAAFDNRHEFETCLHETASELRARRERGEGVDPSEHVSGVVHESGYHRKQQNARLVQRTLEHGVPPASVEHVELPSSFALLREDRPPWRRRLARWLKPRR